MFSPLSFTLEVGTILVLIIGVFKYLVRSLERDLPLLKQRVENVEDRLTEHANTTREQTNAVTKLSVALASVAEAIKSMSGRLDRIDSRMDRALAKQR